MNATNVLTGWRVLGLLGMVGTAFAIGGVGCSEERHDSTAGEIRASRFVIVDNAGNERGVVGMSEMQQPAVRLWSTTGETSISLQIDNADMPRLAMVGRNGAVLVELGVLDGLHPLLLFNDGKGNRRLGMVVARDNEVAIFLYDANRTKRCGVALGVDGDPHVVLRDARGKVRARIAVDNADIAAIDLLDDLEAPHVVFQVGKDGVPNAAILGADGTPLWYPRPLAD